MQWQYNRGGRENKKRINIVKSNVRAFGIARGRKATALGPGMWIEMAREGGQKFMATWRKEDEYVAKYWQKRGAKDTWKNVIVH